MPMFLRWASRHPPQRGFAELPTRPRSSLPCLVSFSVWLACALQAFLSMRLSTLSAPSLGPGPVPIPVPLARDHRRIHFRIPRTRRHGVVRHHPSRKPFEHEDKPGHRRCCSTVSTHYQTQCSVYKWILYPSLGTHRFVYTCVLLLLLMLA